MSSCLGWAPTWPSIPSERMPSATKGRSSNRGWEKNTTVLCLTLKNHQGQAQRFIWKMVFTPFIAKINNSSLLRTRLRPYLHLSSSITYSIFKWTKKWQKSLMLWSKITLSIKLYVLFVKTFIFSSCLFMTLSCLAVGITDVVLKACLFRDNYLGRCINLSKVSPKATFTLK